MAQFKDAMPDHYPARFTEGGRVLKPHLKSQLEWTEDNPRGGEPTTRVNGEIAGRKANRRYSSVTMCWGGRRASLWRRTGQPYGD